MVTYVFQEDSMQEGVSDLWACNKDIDQYLTTLETFAESRMQDWTGESQRQYWIHKKQWDDAMIELNDVLNHAGKTVGNTSDNFMLTERSNTKLWT